MSVNVLSVTIIQGCIKDTLDYEQDTTIISASNTCLHRTVNMNMIEYLS